jgi:D-threo-aldose 1-dehydrogenase
VRLWEWCREKNIDLGTLNLQFCLRERRVASTVIGFSRPERVDQNVSAYLETISDEIWTALYEDFGLGSAHR